MIIWGSRLFGKIDEVPGLFSVRTRFFHIYYVPLVPTASFLMLGPESGVELASVQWRSALVGWLRVALWTGAVGALIALITAITPAERIKAVALAACSAAALFASYRFTRATRRRALELCEIAQLSDDMKTRVERHFNRVVRGGVEEF